MDLKQDQNLKRDLELIDYPPADWRKGIYPSSETDSIYDVVIVGAGMAGLTAGAALFKEGIFNIKLFDQNVQGSEGPWKTYARMKTLRSPKELAGPALDIPHLTFRAWYEASFGSDSWRQLEKIPNALWMDYLNWYRQALKLPVENDCTLIDIRPLESGFELKFQQAEKFLQVKSRKVVLATGRSGFGGPYIPSFVAQLPRPVYAHTMESIDFIALKNCCIGVVGVGASSFDAAAVALESGAKQVDLIMRRSQLPNVNKFASTTYKGFMHGYYKLSDRVRLEFMQVAFDVGIPPPVEALKRIKEHQNFHFRSNTSIYQMQYKDNKICLETNQGQYCYDFLILGTGFQIDGYQQPELLHVIDQIALWKDQVPVEIMNFDSRMGNFPYLGPAFEFLPKIPGTASYLNDLYCFNYGATLSHALLSSDIPAISVGANRLAQAIAADFFVQDHEAYLTRLQNYQEEDFKSDDYIPACQ